jgi:hypothetical protein
MQYITRINSLLDECYNKYELLKDKRMVWDGIKMEIRGSTVSYSSYKAGKKEKMKLN